MPNDDPCSGRIGILTTGCFEEDTVGVWASPFHDPAVARQFADILSSEEPVGATAGGQALWNIVGDDGFHDELDARRRAYDESDVRPHAIYWVEQWLAGDRSTWLVPFNDDAVSIVEAALEDWRHRHPVSTIHWRQIDPGDYFDDASSGQKLN